MDNNTISVAVYMVDGGFNEILSNATPAKAIDDYLFPDMRPPVRVIVINAMTEDGKNITLSVFQNRITVNIE